MGLRQLDLKDTMHKTFEIDSYQSKIGNDEDIITLCFSFDQKEAAKDLMGFLERGYDYILDSDMTEGEQSDGTYKVFVELERDHRSHEKILEIIEDVKKLTGLDKLRFRYYKNFRSFECDKDSIEREVPSDPNKYGVNVQESQYSNYKNYFSNSFVDTVYITENEITLKKIYADPLLFDFIDFGKKTDIMNTITESINVNDFAEIIYLSKYIGDYNITKYGSKIVLENNDYCLVVSRVIV